MTLTLLRLNRGNTEAYAIVDGALIVETIHEHGGMLRFRGSSFTTETYLVLAIEKVYKKTVEVQK